MNETKKASGAIYIVPIVYVLGMYLMPVVLWVLALPIILGLVNLAVVLILGEKISRGQLLICTRIIKYALIPFYFLGGLCIAVALLLMFTPVVIMVFVGPAIAVSLSVFAVIFQFFFSVDVIFVIILAIKDRVYSKQQKRQYMQ